MRAALSAEGKRKERKGTFKWVSNVNWKSAKLKLSFASHCLFFITLFYWRKKNKKHFRGTAVKVISRSVSRHFRHNFFTHKSFSFFSKSNLHKYLKIFSLLLLQTCANFIINIESMCDEILLLYSSSALRAVFGPFSNDFIKNLSTSSREGWHSSCCYWNTVVELSMWIERRHDGLWENIFWQPKINWWKTKRETIWNSDFVIMFLEL